jgi:hypothetical protein
LNTDDIAADLRRRIEAGRLPPEKRPPDALPAGSELPTVRAQAKALGVASETVHKARRQLIDGGLIRSSTGRTSIVADDRPLWIITGSTYDRAQREEPSGLTVFEQQTKASGQGARTDHHVGPPVPCPRWASELFEAIPEGRPVVHLSGEGFATPVGADGQPDPSREYVAGIYECHVPEDVAEMVPLLLEDRNEDVREDWIGGVWSVVEKGLGVDLVEQRWRIYGAMTTPDETARFGLPRPVPVMVEENCHSDESGRVLVATRMLKLFGTVLWDLKLPVRR